MKAKPNFVDQQENFSDPSPLNSIGGEEFVKILLTKFKKTKVSHKEDFCIPNHKI